MITSLYLVSNALYVYAVHIFINSIFGRCVFDKRIEFLTYVIFYSLNSCIYIFFDNMALNLIFNILPIFLISLQYKKSILNCIFLTVIFIAVGMFLDWMCSCFDPSAVLVRSNTIQSITLAIVAFIVRVTFKRDEKMLINSFYIFVLITNSIGTIIIGVLVKPSFDIKGFVIAFILILINLLNFYLYDKYIENMRSRLMYNSIDSANKAYKNQLEIIYESDKRIRLLKHDLKNHILNVKNNIQQGNDQEAVKYIDEMSESMNLQNEYIHTGNSDIDCLVNYKLAVAENMNVEYTIKVKLPEELNVKTFDLTVILGNLIDNALNALENADKKILKLFINYAKGMIVIQIENTFGEQKLDFKDSEHGLGLISVRTSLEKYHGTLENNVSDGIYTAKAILYNIKVHK